MGSAANVVNVPQTLKNIWDEDIYDFMYEDQAYLGLVGKSSTFEGEFIKVTVMYGGMNGRSASFPDAQENMSPPLYKTMQVYTRDNFSLWAVDHKLVTLSRSQRGSLVRALAENTEKAASKFKRSSCYGIWANGGGAFAKIKTISTTTITNDTVAFYDINDIRHVDLGDAIQFAPDDGYYGSAGVYGGSAKVKSIDEDLGTVQFDRNVTNISGVAATTTWCFHAGDYNKVFHGVPAYVTLNKPGVNSEPTDIYGMVRTDFPTRLSGNRFATSRILLKEGTKKVLASCFRRNVKTSHIFAPPELYNDIEMSIEGQKRYTDEKVGSIGYRALEFTMQGGKSVKVYSDADIRKSADGTKQYMFGLNLDTWKFHSAEEYPMWLNTVANGGMKMTVEQNANASQGRLGGYAEHYTKAPGQNWVLEVT